MDAADCSVMKINTLLNFGDRRQRRSLDRIGDFATVISKGSVFSGKLNGSDNYVVHGRVEGDCKLKGALVVSPTGHWKGNIEAVDVMISGMVEGDVIASNKVELLASARVTGVIKSPIICMAAGAKHSGELRMGPTTNITCYKESRNMVESQGESKPTARKSGPE